MQIERPSSPEQKARQRDSVSSIYSWLRTFREKHLSKKAVANLREYLFPLVRLTERVAFGGEFRRRLLLACLRLHYRSHFRCSGIWYSEEPHFFEQQIGFFNFAFTKNPPGPYAFYRAFFNSEIVKNGDSVLDIGFGDGFFTKRFLSPRASQVDAIDMELSAITTAKRNNPGPNVSYYLQDAVHEPFPNRQLGAYNLIVWDGALGHFPPESTTIMLKKIKESLHPKGIFAGSESLGSLEGSDHLQFFETLEDLAELFRPFFTHVYVKTVDYEAGNRSFTRQEAYWRCSNGDERLDEVAWRRM